MSEDEIDKKNTITLLSFNRAALIRKLKQIEKSLESICKENNYRYFEMDRYALRCSTEKHKIYVSIRENKFRFKDGDFNNKVYFLDELFNLPYSKELLKALFEVYTNVDNIFDENLKVL